MTFKGWICLILALSLTSTVWAQDAPDSPDFAAAIQEDDVMTPLTMLAVEIGARPMGSGAERTAAEYVADQFAQWGYTVTWQPFALASGKTSQNIIATRPGSSADPGLIVIGAHLDSVIAGTGADDNGTGVAALLAAAHALAPWETAHTLVFVAFGAEESGTPAGSTFYVDELGADVAHVIAMINIDTVGAGEPLNAYAGARILSGTNDRGGPNFEPGPVWVRDAVLDQAAALGIVMGTTPPESWDGFTGDWSDHYPFVLADVPVAYIEAWSWTSGPDPWWGQETPDGDILHTPADVIDNVNPLTVEHAAEVVAATVYAIAFEQQPQTVQNDD